jgi:putative two-component system response regulator
MRDKAHLLFVDDEQHDLLMLQRMLKGFDDSWAASCVQSVNDAMEAVRQGPVDVIVTDLRMPGKDGFCLLKELMEDQAGQDVPVIVLTGSMDCGIKRRALELGATDLLNKPVTMEDLVARVRNVLRMKAYRDQLKKLNDTLEDRVRKRTADLERSKLDLFCRLAKAGEYRDEETGNHVVRVGQYSQLIADTMGYDHTFCDTMFLVSPLHDIGKIGIPDAILMKPGPLTPEERLVMQRHCQIGEDILLQPPRGLAPYLKHRYGQPLNPLESNDNAQLRIAALIARHHHEWWNGQGYPDHLNGRSIPIEARIVALADSYDALRSTRPYKPGFPHERALAIIAAEAGTHFDPDVYDAFHSLVDAFMAVWDEFPDDLVSPEEYSERM